MTFTVMYMYGAFDRSSNGVSYGIFYMSDKKFLKEWKANHNQFYISIISLLMIQNYKTLNTLSSFHGITMIV